MERREQAREHLGAMESSDLERGDILFSDLEVRQGDYSLWSWVRLMVSIQKLRMKFWTMIEVREELFFIISQSMFEDIIPMRVSGSDSSSSWHFLRTSETSFSVRESNSNVSYFSFVVVIAAHKRDTVLIHSFWTDSSKELNASFLRWFQIISQKCLITWIGNSSIII